MTTLGGIDWNTATKSLMEILKLPVSQVADWKVKDGQYWEVAHGPKHRPVLEKLDDEVILREDVALFARAVNPYNRKRTVTICNGMYGRGTRGAVLALTDNKFRDRNAGYVRSQFSGSNAYCILTRVPIVNGMVMTPDWTTSDYILFEWSR